MNVAVIARYPVLRAGLRAILAAERIEVVAEASTVGDLARDPVFREVDVALVDPGADFDGRELDAMMRDSPSLRPVLLGPVQHAELLSASLDGRAWGYLRREADGDVLAAAVRAVAAGLVVVERDLARSVIVAPAPARHLLDDALPEELSPRELEVLQLVAEGLANKMIAARLRISEHTVKFHVASILGKLGAASRTEASHTAARRGLVAL